MSTHLAKFKRLEKLHFSIFLVQGIEHFQKLPFN